MNIKKHIPNAITCMSLVSGCIAVQYAAFAEVQPALIWIVIAAIFDFLDGFAARALKAYSPIGKDLDSLSDMVSFGVAPGMLVYSLLSVCAAMLELPEAIAFLGFIIPVFSALRLAKFNNDPRQSDSFIGLPVPAHTLLWASIVYALAPYTFEYPLPILCALIIGSFLTSLLMVSEIPMFSLKIKSLKWKGNELRYLLVVSTVLFLIFFGAPGIAFTIVLYILLSIFNIKR